MNTIQWTFIKSQANHGLVPASVLGLIAKLISCGGWLLLVPVVWAAEAGTLPSTAPLTGDHDFSAEMRVAIRHFLQVQLDEAIKTRPVRWKRDFSTREAYEQSVEPNRERLRKMIGAVDPRIQYFEPELVSTVSRGALIAETAKYTVRAIRWPVVGGVWGEGLLLDPKSDPVARVVALPDADQTPEMISGLVPSFPRESRFAARLASAGCQVVVPVLLSRSDDFSGSPGVVMTNQTHREWIYRQAFTMGRHIIGYEVEKVLAALDWFDRLNSNVRKLPVGLAGYLEGGLISLYTGAIDRRVDAVMVSGYFDSRQGIADEPIYRNIFGLLAEFGDAELASLIAPRPLVIEYSKIPTIAGPPAVRPGRRNVAALGRIVEPPFARVQQEVDRVASLFPGEGNIKSAVEVVAGSMGTAVGVGSDDALRAFLRGLGVDASRLTGGSALPDQAASLVDETVIFERQRRQVEQLVELVQPMVDHLGAARERFWADAKPTSALTWPAATAKYRDYFWDELVGRFPPPTISPNARTRRIGDKPKFIVYEVQLDVTPNLFAWGYLLVPKDLKPGERRPVVVCQHGVEGVPADVVDDENKESQAFRYYRGFASRLAERGFITYAPHNFYRGGNEFRQLQRLAHPLKKTLFGVTAIQHAQMLRWLSTLGFVDPTRIGYYGLSYGGNTAMRVPPLLEQYAVVISSGSFNDWVYKSATNENDQSFIMNGTYEVFEWDIGHTFNNAEMAALIAPRPFMVERGHDDPVARDERVASEYAKVRRLYAKLGIPERTAIEFFNGWHEIHGVGTFEFLHRHLNWPQPVR